MLNTVKLLINVRYLLTQNLISEASQNFTIVFDTKIQIQILQLFLLRPLQSDRWRITEVSQHVFHSRRQTEIKMMVAFHSAFI